MNGTVASSGVPFDRFRPIEMIAVMILATSTMLPTLLKPLLLGAMVQEGRLTAVQLGQAAAAEQFGMAITAFCAGAWLRPARLRWIALAAMMVCAAANFVTSQVFGGIIVPVRFFSGVASGTTIWLIMAMVARLEWPARFVGIYFSAQASVALSFSAIFSAWALPTAGAAGSFQILVGLIFVAMAVILLIPRRFSDLAQTSRSWVPRGRGWLGLGIVAIYMSAGLAIWVYVVPLAGAAGLSRDVANLAVTVGFASQIAGGLVSSALARHLSPDKTMIGVALAGLAAAGIIIGGLAQPLFVLAVGVVAFLLSFGGAFNTPLLNMIDPSRRAAMLCGSAQLIGQSTGMFSASVLVGGIGVQGACLAGVLFYLTGLAGILIIRHGVGAMGVAKA